VELVLVDNGIRLGDFLFIGTGASLEIRLLVPLLDGVEKVVALRTELHCDILLFDVYRFLLICKT
jgi:hypothetical protein